MSRSPHRRPFLIKLLSRGEAADDAVVILATVRHGAGAAVLDARTIGTVYIGEGPTAVLAQAIQRAKAEQAVQILSRHVVTWVELTGAVIEEPIILTRGRIAHVAVLPNHRSSLSRPNPFRPAPGTSIEGQSLN